MTIQELVENWKTYPAWGPKFKTAVVTFRAVKGNDAALDGGALNRAALFILTGHVPEQGRDDSMVRTMLEDATKRQMP